MSVYGLAGLARLILNLYPESRDDSDEKARDTVYYVEVS